MDMNWMGKPYRTPINHIDTIIIKSKKYYTLLAHPFSILTIVQHVVTFISIWIWQLWGLPNIPKKSQSISPNPFIRQPQKLQPNVQKFIPFSLKMYIHNKNHSLSTENCGYIEENGMTKKVLALRLFSGVLFYSSLLFFLLLLLKY
jgi:hypothetical protein